LEGGPRWAVGGWEVGSGLWARRGVPSMTEEYLFVVKLFVTWNIVVMKDIMT
jgi:hypothetical protein